MTYDEVVKLLRDRFGADAVTTSAFRDNQRVTVPAERAHDALVASGLEPTTFAYPNGNITRTCHTCCSPRSCSFDGRYSPSSDRLLTPACHRGFSRCA